MPTSPTHIARVRSNIEREENLARQRANAIFDLVSTLAQTRSLVTDPDLQVRISAALLNAHIALSGFVPQPLPTGVVPIVGRKAS
jgi:hypothetical protein